MLLFIKNILNKPGGRNTLIVLSGTIINSLIGGVFFILAPRLIGPESYGIFAVVSSTGILITSFANLGIDTGILRFASEKSEAVNKLLKIAFLSYVSIGLTVFALGFLLAAPIASYFGIPSQTNLFRIAFSGVILFLLTDFFVATLQAKEKFVNAFVVTISSNITRLLLILIAAYFYAVNIYFLTALFFFVAVVSVAVGKMFTPFDFLKAKDVKPEIKNFYKFDFWIAASFAVSAFPLDNYMLLKFSGPLATGIYAAPFKLLSIVDQLAGNYSRVLAPKITQISNEKSVVAFIKQTLPVSLPIAFVFLVLSLIASPVVSVILGKDYLGSIPVFSIIALASIFTFLTAIPVSLTIYYFKAPSVTFTITAITIIFWVSLNFFMIPRFNEIGAALAYLSSEVLTFLLFSFYIVYKFHQLKK